MILRFSGGGKDLESVIAKSEIAKEVGTDTKTDVEMKPEEADSSTKLDEDNNAATQADLPRTFISNMHYYICQIIRILKKKLYSMTYK